MIPWVGRWHLSWKKQRRLQGKNKYYSLSKKLRRENKSNDEFEVMVSQLTLEELIGLKLELASKVLDGRLFGLPVWSSMHSIVQDAMLKWVYSASRTKVEAVRYLGINQSDFKELLKKYKVDDYFSDLDVDNDKEV
jgi:transcriptional regulator with AAA-type ATPase domain